MCLGTANPGSRPDRMADSALCIGLVYLNNIAIGIVKENLVPAVHRPFAVVGIGNALVLESLLEGLDVVGAKGDVTAFDRIDNVLHAEAQFEVLGGQMKLGLAIRHEGDGGGIAIRSDARIIQRGLRVQIKDGAIKLVHCWNILRAQIEVMEPDFHADSPKNSPRTNEITSL